MKNLFVFILLIFSTLCVNAQNKKITKIQTLYDAKSYDECIDAAKKYVATDASNATPYYCMGFSYFEQYKKNTSKEYLLKNAESSVLQAVNKDKNGNIGNSFKNNLSELHDTISNISQRLYANKENSKAGEYAQMLAKIFKDTTEIYSRIYQPEKYADEVCLGKKLEIYKGPVNQLDKNGKKQGIWIDRFKNGKRKSQINFQDGKPVGDYYKFYETGGIKAHLHYFNDSLASAVIYTENGDRSAMGYYYNRKKDSLWQYFEADSLLITEENYTKGIKNGKETTYYIFGFPCEELNWKNGVKDGLWKRYYPSSTVDFETTYKNGILNGTYTKYDIKGNKIIMGQYKNDLRVGQWKVYNEETKKFITRNYINGKLENAPELDEAESKYMDEQTEKGRLLPDPKDYIHNPEDYPQR